MATDSLKSDEQAQNDLNIKLHAQPWYQAFLAQNGQNPQKVKLSGDQRKALQALAAQNGVVLPKGVQFDPSGNVNEQHGFAGQPGWAKALEIGGALAAGGLIAAPLLAGPGAMTAASAAAAPAATEAGIFGASAALPAVAAGTGALSTVGNLIKGGSTFDKVADILNAGGKSIGAATTAAGQNRLEADRAAQNAFSNNIRDKSLQEAAEANQAALDRQSLYRSTVAKNPMTSPYNTRGPQVISPEMMAGLSDMEKQALLRISKGPAPFVPYTPKTPSTLETVGNWASPIASTIGTIGKLL